ncbi:MAG: type II toxin-antitoxin system PemK/MazF family toxin [Acidobacteria bacterium]|jgi:mRNA interferase MazF|nr:type II toxin-antitoxin system PemK/MazF family toxin [Acidobacteriota bacterium]
MIQGDVCYHTFKSPDKRRPVLILTRSSAIPKLIWLTIAPITTTTRNLPTEVWLDEGDGLNEICAVNLDNIQTVQKEKLGRVLTQLSDERMQEVFEAIKFAFGFDK